MTRMFVPHASVLWFALIVNWNRDDDVTSLFKGQRDADRSALLQRFKVFLLQLTVK